jgi:hypothetical protein
MIEEVVMKKAVAAVSILFLMLATSSLAQQHRMKWRGSGGWGMGAQYSRMYDVKTVESITGEIVSIDTFRPQKGMSYGVHLMLKTDKETIPVHLGPAWYIENQDVKLSPKDKIEVKGSRIIFEGKPTIIAAEVKKDDEVLTLRDSNGVPMWSGWRRR